MNIETLKIKHYTDIYNNKKIIYEENRKKSGVYYFLNYITGKMYIGSSINLTYRIYKYFSVSCLKGALLKHNSLIYKSLLKYGYNHFEFGILKYCNQDEVLK